MVKLSYFNSYATCFYFRFDSLWMGVLGMVVNRFVFLLLFGLVLAGCTQPQASPSSTPSPSTTVLPTVEAVATADASPSSDVVTPTPRIPYIASAKPSELPSSTPAPSVATGIPTLVEFAAEFNVATQRAFNDSRKVYVSSSDVWVVDQTTSGYQYTIFIRPSKGRSFGAFDTVVAINGASGVAKNVSLDSGEKGPFFKYAVLMRCYDAHYDVEMALLDYTTLPGSGQYRRTLGPAVMLTLVDACPN